MAIILGLGFTGQALAHRLRDRNEPVFAPVRGVNRFPEMAGIGVHLSEWTDPQMPSHDRIAWLIPPLPEPERSQLRQTVESIAPHRVVYVSSTGVYGANTSVDEHSTAAPNDPKGHERMEDEQWLSTGHRWTTLILRAAAIYGPGRGVHAAVKEGRTPRGAGAGVVSRIHVEDLAALIDVGLFTSLEGAWPVADDEPCASIEIIQWCANFLKITAANSEPGLRISPGRRVDGRQIRERLGVRLKYPSWRVGVPASL